VPIFVDGHKVQASIVGRVEELGSLPAEFQGESFIWSEPVEWRSEYRCYVLDSQILGIEWSFLRVPRGSDPSDVERRTPEVRPPIAIVEGAIRRLDEAGESVAGYCLDFGLTAQGDMVLVEMNDALALTNYGLDIGPYVDLHVSRWRQLAGVGRDGGRAQLSHGKRSAQRHGSESGH
jgi:hypothetical protein